jgi:hypothetical protein
VATPTQLIIYNGALRLLGQPKLATLTDNNERRRALDDAWDDAALDFCLEQGNWNFATRAVKIEVNSAIDPDFGFDNAFDVPSDWMKTVTTASDEYFRYSATDQEVQQEQSYWFSDFDALYVRYISNDSSYGADYSLWPRSFLRLVQAFMARETSPRLIQNAKNREAIELVYNDSLVFARSQDALNEGVKFMPPTGWGMARGGRGGRSGRRDRGSRGSLTG